MPALIGIARSKSQETSQGKTLAAFIAFAAFAALALFVILKAGDEADMAATPAASTSK